MIRVSTRRDSEAADPLDRQVLDRPQQLRLRRRRQVRHLVEKQRALVRVLELAAPPAHAGRRPLLDPEQLRLEQRLDDRGAVDGNEGPLAPPAQLVNLPRHELLAGARFAFDEHREIGRGHALDAVAHGANREARSDERRRAVHAVPAGQAAPLRAFDLEDERGDVRRRVEELARPAVEHARRLEHGLDTRAMMRHAARHVEASSRRLRRARSGSSQSVMDRACTSARKHLLESLRARKSCLS